MFDWGDLNSHFDLSLFLTPNFKSDLLEILKPLVAAYREDVLIELVEVGVAAFSDDSEHELMVAAVILDEFVLESDSHIHLLDRTRE